MPEQLSGSTRHQVGSCAPGRIEEMIEECQSAIADARAWESAQADQAERAEQALMAAAIRAVNTPVPGT